MANKLSFDAAAWVTTRQEMLSTLSATESHPESLLAVSLHCVGIPAGWVITPQFDVVIGVDVYRLDFALTSGDRKVAIEVDGHEFHHSSVAVVDRDNTRRNALQGAGWVVLNFSASQVWRDPIGTAKGILAGLTVQEAAASRPNLYGKKPTPEQLARYEAIAKAEAAGDEAEVTRLMNEVVAAKKRDMGLA